MISKIKNIMETSERLNELNAKVNDSTSVVFNQSKEMENFRVEVSGLRDEVCKFSTEASKFSQAAFTQLAGIKKSNDDLRDELYDFKLIKSEVKSKLVSELLDDFRTELRKEMTLLDSDVKRFNQLKEEVGSLTMGLKTVEEELAKFRQIAAQIDAGDFELQRHARELQKADSEKLRLMNENERLKSLLAKERRGKR